MKRRLLPAKLTRHRPQGALSRGRLFALLEGATRKREADDHFSRRGLIDLRT